MPRRLNKLLRHVKSRRSKKFEAKCDYDTKESLVDRVVRHGGSESATFNRLEVQIFRKLEGYPWTPDCDEGSIPRAIYFHYRE